MLERLEHGARILQSRALERFGDPGADAERFLRGETQQAAVSAAAVAT